jgi:hypothetical protein
MPDEPFDEKLDEIFRGIEQQEAVRRLRENHPYLLDLMEVLRPHGPRGLARSIVLHTLERDRRTNGLPMPEKFEEAVQSVYNRYCVDSAVFKKRKVRPSDGLFYSPRGKGSGVWAVHLDRATEWLSARLKP